MIPLDIYDGIDPDIDGDKPREECGVFAVHLPEPADIAALCHLGVFALQHRGQESCGICVSNGEDIVIEKDMGLVAEVFTEERIEKLRLPDMRTGIGHTRYSTTGSSLRFNAQPLTVRSNKGLLALAHNGNFTNAKAIRAEMLGNGAVLSDHQRQRGDDQPHRPLQSTLLRGRHRAGDERTRGRLRRRHHGQNQDHRAARRQRGATSRYR